MGIKVFKLISKTLNELTKVLVFPMEVSETQIKKTYKKIVPAK